ncbi:hypothetical protein BD309DRAFT_869770 [Dichomitus squalens]|uniref:Phosphatidate cytidylyltransferase n=2 Tax=Dichomitus squalens TaxID=114155 RepID=A0A4Q9PG01_9APHY|nr:uncharacterized protein DICSQDRAFT_89106 [Dichomitus squalens LYAD-421 SS1]EJF59713.1 hypothetical protein DICSQDRAFT_89106 [Dichomitus squalens LYAD-421 SS1]TBU21924.1 hypothetical protein BD311DRAFT_782644 [Dichomitus squalens]TBU40689.1 hypothetical protein BD309DRAFT_869770 [Dichomitus squalens]TBU52087.1 hypothetical protein BD310DRAFT_832932 [Dichomitus squalens]
MSVDSPESPPSPDSRNLPSHSAVSSVRNGVPNGAPLRQRKKARTASATSPDLATKPKDLKPSRPPVDWEIPRKTLHSSIGFLTWYLYASNGNPRTVVYALGLALAVIVPADILRFKSDRFEWLYERAVGFLMRESEKKAVNGVIWYILGVIFVLSVYPLDIATVSILILSWADTAASTIGRLWGTYTPPLPRSLPLIPYAPFFRLPLAPRKSLAGFLAGSITGAAIAVGFWGFWYPVRDAQLVFHLPTPETLAAVNDLMPEAAAHALQESVQWLQNVDIPLGRWIGLTTLGVVSGLISGTAEALDLGALDDNLTLPIISGGCIWGFFKVLEFFTGSA